MWWLQCSMAVQAYCLGTELKFRLDRLSAGLPGSFRTQEEAVQMGITIGCRACEVLKMLSGLLPGSPDFEQCLRGVLQNVWIMFMS